MESLKDALVVISKKARKVRKTTPIDRLVSEELIPWLMWFLEEDPVEDDSQVAYLSIPLSAELLTFLAEISQLEKEKAEENYIEELKTRSLGLLLAFRAELEGKDIEELGAEWKAQLEEEENEKATQEES